MKDEPHLVGGRGSQLVRSEAIMSWPWNSISRPSTSALIPMQRASSKRSSVTCVSVRIEGSRAAGTASGGRIPAIEVGDRGRS